MHTDTITDSVSTEDLAVTPDEHWPFYAEDEISGVVATLRSGKVNQMTGDQVYAFQAAYDEYLGRGRSIALANGSVALELALRAWGIGAGDEVIVTPRTFVASVSCVRLVGATPVFADVDRDSGNITAETIAAKLTPRTKAVIPVHLAGWPCDMPAIMALAEQHGFKVLEDCAQAHGAEIDGQPIGTFGHAAAFSFCQDKIMSTGGEGGLTAFADDADFEWAWSFKDHGKNRSKIMEAPVPGSGFRYVHDMVGTNWRMLATSAVIGIAQLGKLDAWRDVRAERAAVWQEALGGIEGLRAPVPVDGVRHANYKWYAYVDPTDGNLDGAQAKRDEIMRRATELGIRAFSGSGSEAYLEGAFSDLDVAPLPVAHELGRTSLLFEVHPTLDLERLRRRAAAVADIVRDVLGA